MARVLALPLQVTATGVLATLEQDSPTEVAQSVALLLATRPGDRRSVPDYGYPDPIGDGVDPDELAEVVGEWEDRADPAEVELTVTAVGEQAVTVRPAAPAADPDSDLVEEA